MKFIPQRMKPEEYEIAMKELTAAYAALEEEGA